MFSSGMDSDLGPENTNGANGGHPPPPVKDNSQEDDEWPTEVSVTELTSI